jgi:endogenous inhibitor of DNA gyrase (YacG/DUF329 family)
MKVKCPHCKKEFEYKTSEYRPFCSEKCKLIDLGSWLDGSYAIATEEKGNDENQDS